MGSVDVQPAATVSLPTTVERGREFIVRVTGVAEDVEGHLISLRIGDSRHTWIADDKPHTQPYTVKDDSEELAIEIRNEDEGWIIWEGSIAVIQVSRWTSAVASPSRPPMPGWMRSSHGWGSSGR